MLRRGGVELDVPSEATDGKEEGVFYNPEMGLNRDLTVATLQAYREAGEVPAATYLDATAARGVRVADDDWNDDIPGAMYVSDIPRTPGFSPPARR